MNSENFNDLLDLYVTGALGEEEQDRLFRLIEQPEYFRYLQERLQNDWENGRYEGPENPALRNIIESSVNNKIDLNHRSIPVRRIHFRGRWSRAAASILFVIAVGAAISLYSDRQSSDSGTSETTARVDITPGTVGAILTLADGTQVVLDSLGNGVIANQNGSEVVLENGRLAYDLSGATNGDVVYNTMTTPRGRQFQVVLPDGTKVWLNAASSIRYPTVFAGKERHVTITGEAYFEVAKNAKKPFRVNVNQLVEVEVLGTNFNVNAYENERTINTTLLQGSVRVNETTIKPGQQAQINGAVASSDLRPSSSIKLINDADIDKVIAWKNGAFNFNNASLEDVMKQLERWYDIEVVYEKEIPDIHFVGKMSRDVSLAGLTRTLKKTGVRFRIEGRRLVVLP